MIEQSSRYVNRYAFTDCGPAMIWTKRKLSTYQARKIFSKAGLTVERFAPNWSHFLGWANIIEIDEDGKEREREHRE